MAFCVAMFDLSNKCLQYLKYETISVPSHFEFAKLLN